MIAPRSRKVISQGALQSRHGATNTSIPDASSRCRSSSLIPSSVINTCTKSKPPSDDNDTRPIFVESATR